MQVELSKDELTLLTEWYQAMVDEEISLDDRDNDLNEKLEAYLKGE